MHHGRQPHKDFNVSFSPEAVASGELTYNYCPGNFKGTEAPGLSVFERAPDGGTLHFYSTYGRGLDAFNGAYQLLDLTPKGRDEGALDWPQQWIRRHDQYN